MVVPGGILAGSSPGPALAVARGRWSSIVSRQPGGLIGYGQTPCISNIPSRAQDDQRTMCRRKASGLAQELRAEVLVW